MIKEYIDQCNLESKRILSMKKYDILSSKTKDELFHLYYSKCLCNAYMKCLKREEEPMVKCDKLVDEYMYRK